MKYIPIAEQLRRERANNIALREQAERTAANVDYIAMMCDIDLDNEDGEEVSEIEE